MTCPPKRLDRVKALLGLPPGLVGSGRTAEAYHSGVSFNAASACVGRLVPLPSPSPGPLRPARSRSRRRWSRQPLQVIASNLNNPRKIFLGPDGALYVVEAGLGAPRRSGSSQGCKSSCVGDTASIVRIRDGKKTEVVTGLVSLSNPLKVEAEGPPTSSSQGVPTTSDAGHGHQCAGRQRARPQLATAGDLLARGPAG